MASPKFLETLQHVRTIVVHDNCADGWASAFLLRDVLPNAELVFVQYGTKKHETLPATEGMLFADFSPLEARAQEFLEVKTLILDHHKSAKYLVDMFGDLMVFGDEVKDPGVSGATLCYEHVWKPLKANPSEQLSNFAKYFSQLAGVRDTWQTSDPNWGKACLQKNALTFFPKEMLLEYSLQQLADSWSFFETLGKIVEIKNNLKVQQAIKGAVPLTTSKGTAIRMFENVLLSSDVSEAIKEENIQIVCGFDYFRDEGVSKLVFSIRSNNRYNCSDLCKFFGGGGHTNAAGFNIVVEPTSLNPYTSFLNCVEQFELSRISSQIPLV